MTRDEIDALMREAGITVVGEAVYKLCELVAAAEREACAKVCDEIVSRSDEEYAVTKSGYVHGMADSAEICAAKIRARGAL